MTTEAATDTAPARVPDVAVSLIRTWVPIGVGSLVAWLAASRHIVISAHASAAVGVAAAGVCASTYYGAARLLEHVAGAGRPARMARTVGRYMLGGVLAKPVYVSDADYRQVADWIGRHRSEP